MRPSAAGDDRRDVRVDRRSGIDHRQFVFAHQVRVGARAGHHARIGSDDACHETVEPLGNAGGQVVRGLRGLPGIAPANLRVGRVVAMEDPGPRAALRERGSLGLDGPFRAGVSQRVGDGPEAGEFLQHGRRRRRDLDLLAGGALQCVGGAQPDAAHGLVVVVRAMLAPGSAGQEEAGVEPARARRRRDPVVEVDEFAGRQHERVARKQVGERELAAIERRALVGESRDVLGRRRRAGLVVRQQDAGLFEAFAGGRDPVGEPAGRQPEQRARFRIGQPDDARLQPRVGIRSFQRAAGEHMGTGQERLAGRAPLHEQFRPVRRIAEQDQRCGGTNVQRWLASPRGTSNAKTGERAAAWPPAVRAHVSAHSTSPPSAGRPSEATCRDRMRSIPRAAIACIHRREEGRATRGTPGSRRTPIGIGREPVRRAPARTRPPGDDAGHGGRGNLRERRGSAPDDRARRRTSPGRPGGAAGAQRGDDVTPA